MGTRLYLGGVDATVTAIKNARWPNAAETKAMTTWHIDWNPGRAALDLYAIMPAWPYCERVGVWEERGDTHLRRSRRWRRRRRAFLAKFRPARGTRGFYVKRHL